jgi:hypothetical protein
MEWTIDPSQVTSIGISNTRGDLLLIKKVPNNWDHVKSGVFRLENPPNDIIFPKIYMNLPNRPFESISEAISDMGDEKIGWWVGKKSIKDPSFLKGLLDFKHIEYDLKNETILLLPESGNLGSFMTFSVKNSSEIFASYMLLNPLKSFRFVRNGKNG